MRTRSGWVVAGLVAAVLAASTCVLPAADKIGGAGGASASTTASASSGMPASGGSASSSTGSGGAGPASSSTASSSSSSSASSSSASSSSGSCAPGSFVAHEITSVAADGQSVAPTGLATQRHVVYSPNTKRWWLFYVDGSQPMKLQAISSSDFVSWSSPATFGLPYASSGDGRTLSLDLVQRASADGVDVAVTLACTGAPCNQQNGLYLVRGQLAGANVTFDSSAIQVCLDKANTTPYVDPPVVSVPQSADNYVAIASGCDPDYPGGAWTIYTSQTSDKGQPNWMPTGWDHDNLYSGPGQFGRGLVPYNGGFLFAGEQTVSQNSPTIPPATVYWAAGSGSNFMPTDAEIFTNDGVTQDLDGWSLFGATSGVDAGPPTLHALRYITSTPAYEHAQFDGATWTLAASKPSMAHTPASGTGVFTASTGTTHLAFIIDSATQDVMTAAFTDSMSTWDTTWNQAPVGGTRQYIAGYSEPVNGQIALLWTEGPNMGRYEIWGGLFCMP